MPNRNKRQTECKKQFERDFDRMLNGEIEIKDEDGNVFVPREGENTAADFRMAYSNTKRRKCLPRYWFVSIKGTVISVSDNTTVLNKIHKTHEGREYVIVSPKQMGTKNPKAVYLYDLVGIIYGAPGTQFANKRLDKDGIKAFSNKRDGVHGHHTAGLITPLDGANRETILLCRAYNCNPKLLKFIGKTVHERLFAENISDEKRKANALELIRSGDLSPNDVIITEVYVVLPNGAIAKMHYESIFRSREGKGIKVIPQDEDVQWWAEVCADPERYGKAQELITSVAKKSDRDFETCEFEGRIIAFTIDRIAEWTE